MLNTAYSDVVAFAVSAHYNLIAKLSQTYGADVRKKAKEDEKKMKEHVKEYLAQMAQNGRSNRSNTLEEDLLISRRAEEAEDLKELVQQMLKEEMEPFKEDINKKLDLLLEKLAKH